MKKTYTGGCHCGAVRFEADMDLSQGTVKCNCSICSKGRAWLTGVAGSDFRLLKGADSVGDYQFGAHRIHHRFCTTCGIKCFGHSDGAENERFHAVFISTLDNLSDDELASIPVSYVDGRNDNFKQAPAETRHL
jgi:hypothetical protein